MVGVGEVRPARTSPVHPPTPPTLQVGSDSSQKRYVGMKGLCSSSTEQHELVVN